MTSSIFKRLFSLNLALLLALVLAAPAAAQALPGDAWLAEPLADAAVSLAAERYAKEASFEDEEQV